jgi:hypothetical protein
LFKKYLSERKKDARLMRLVDLDNLKIPCACGGQIRWCGRCWGRGFKLTPDGEALLDFIKENSDELARPMNDALRELERDY